MSETSFANDIVAILNDTDQLLGPDPGGFDFCPSTIAILTLQYASGILGDTQEGPATTIHETDLPPWTRVRQLSTREIAGSGGRFEQGDLMVGPVRPTFLDATTGLTAGFSAAALDPQSTQPGTDVIYRLTPTDPLSTGFSGDYQLIELRRDDRFEFLLVLRRRR